MTDGVAIGFQVGFLQMKIQKDTKDMNTKPTQPTSCFLRQHNDLVIRPSDSETSDKLNEAFLSAIHLSASGSFWNMSY